MITNLSEHALKQPHSTRNIRLYIIILGKSLNNINKTLGMKRNLIARISTEYYLKCPVFNKQQKYETAKEKGKERATHAHE